MTETDADIKKKDETENKLFFVVRFNPSFRALIPNDAQLCPMCLLKAFFPTRKLFSDAPSRLPVQVFTC